MDVSEVIAKATERHAHHEAGHAVAAVFIGGELVEVYLGTVGDWSQLPSDGDTLGGTVHRTPYERQPFVTFAGPWAEARWSLDNEADIEDIDEALQFAWDSNGDGDGAKYEARIEKLSAIAAEMGLSPVGAAWEAEWSIDLASLWPAICEVAQMLLDGIPVSHDTVRSLTDKVEA